MRANRAHDSMKAPKPKPVFYAIPIRAPISLWIDLASTHKCQAVEAAWTGNQTVDVGHNLNHIS